jgi:4-hydroxybenzoate polyprenyltransferase
MAVGSLSPAALMLAVFAFLNAGAQETLYNLVDREDDAAADIMTTAVRLGPGKTLGLFAVLTVTCSLAVMVPWIIHLGSPLYIWTALPCTAIPLLGIVLYVWLKRTQESYRRAHRVMKLVRLSSVIPVLLLR